MGLDVLGDPHSDLRGRRDGHDTRALAPALIGVFVDIAVIAGQVASTVHLEHKLAEWHQSAHFALRSAIERRRPEAWT